MIAKSTIDEVLEASNIVEVVSDYLTLKKSGSHYKCCCCFHNDKNPSLTIFPKTGTYKCFSCGKQGNSIGFVMEHDKISFPEAVWKISRIRSAGNCKKCPLKNRKIQRTLYAS